MSYNIRYDNPKDAENAWPNRKETLVNQILFYAPDILGIQEGLEHQVNYINDKLESYSFVGIGRADLKEKGKGTSAWNRSIPSTIVDEYINIKSGYYQNKLVCAGFWASCDFLVWIDRSEIKP